MHLRLVKWLLSKLLQVCNWFSPMYWYYEPGKATARKVNEEGSIWRKAWFWYDRHLSNPRRKCFCPIKLIAISTKSHTEVNWVWRSPNAIYVDKKHMRPEERYAYASSINYDWKRANPTTQRYGRGRFRLKRRKSETRGKPADAFVLDGGKNKLVLSFFDTDQGSVPF